MFASAMAQSATQAFDPDEEQRLIRAATIDPLQFEPLYTKYYRAILLFVYRRVDSKEEAQDLTQQVFVTALTQLKKYEFRGLPFSAWLYRMAINEINQLFRKSKIQRAVNIDEAEIEDLKNETYEGQHDDATLYEALSKLPHEDLHLIEMRYFEKRHFAEIGQLLNISESNAKVRTYRVIDKLKKILMVVSGVST